MVFFAILSVIVILLVLHRKLVSSNSTFPIEYPDVIFLNNTAIDSDYALSQISDVTTPFMQNVTILESDIEKIKDAIKSLGWVENVSVERSFPNKLKFIISSKEIVAYKLKNNQYYPITSHGEELSKPVDYIGGLVVLGNGAENELIPLLQKIKKFPRLFNSVIAVQYINGLRFNLILYGFDASGLVIKLDNNFNEGVNKLMELDVTQGILSRNISEIDLRDLDKILVKPR